MSSADPFRLLQSGDALAALQAAAGIAASDPDNARAHLAAGIALRALGRFEPAREALERAARLAPQDFAPAYELGVLHEFARRDPQALEQFERAAALRPAFAPPLFAAGLAAYRLGDWARAARHFSGVLAIEPRNLEALVNLAQSRAEESRHEEAREILERAIAAHPDAAIPRYAMGWLSRRLGRRDEAARRYEQALARDPRHLDALLALGRDLVSRGDYSRAAELYARAAAVAPADPDLPLYIAQTLLLLGRWNEAWRWYARRDSRIAFEAAERAAGRRYAVPSLQELRGRDVRVVAEQGLGDNLFFARFAARLRSAASSVSFAGDARLRSILERTRAFDRIDESPAEGEVRILVADLPRVVAQDEDVFVPSLSAAPDAAREAAVCARLARAGPRPWVAVTWRSGTPRERSRQALSKSVPPAELFAALAAVAGTVFALQRGASAEELESASQALGRPVHDLARESEEPEDALAVVALVDRYVGVSSTNMHLAALAGRTAEVLVPFPPEWRWRAEGESPWFPGFRVLRQSRDGDWSHALAALSG